MNKNDLKYVHTLSIGGVDHSLQLKMIHINDFFEKYNRVLVENEIDENDSAYVAANKSRIITVKVSDLIADVVFKSMFKTGFLFWKKPFRNPGQMMKKLLKEEYHDFSSFVADHIMNDPKKDDKKKAEAK